MEYILIVGTFIVCEIKLFPASRDQRFSIYPGRSKWHFDK